MLELEMIQDKIDEYIRGAMSVSERVKFEEELRKNADLRQEVEVQTYICDAVQAVHLKQFLQQIELDMASAKDKNPKPEKLDGDRRSVVIVRASVYRRQFLYWVGAAAAVSLFFFAGNEWRQTRRIKGFGNECYAALVEPISRDGNEIDSLVASCYSLIGAREFDVALKSLNEARSMITDGLNKPVIDEEGVYRHKVLQEKLYEVEWYDAVILMQQGKFRKAKQALRSIVVSGSPYAENAKRIL